MEVIWRGRSRAPDQTAEGGSSYCGNTADALHPAEGTPERGGDSRVGQEEGRFGGWRGGGDEAGMCEGKESNGERVWWKKEEEEARGEMGRGEG